MCEHLLTGTPLCTLITNIKNKNLIKGMEKTHQRILSYILFTQSDLPNFGIYRVSQEERTKLREGVPYVKLYRYNPKHLYPKLNGYGDNGQRKVWTSCISAFYTPTAASRAAPPTRSSDCVQNVRWLVLRRRAPPNAIRQYFIAARFASSWNPKGDHRY